MSALIFALLMSPFALWLLIDADCEHAPSSLDTLEAGRKGAA